MQPAYRKWAVKVCVFCILAVFCCHSYGEATIISGTGTIKFISLEGGFYGIIADDGRRYLPLNLEKKFKKDGIKVKFKARLKHVPTIYMWGVPVEILEMKEIQ